MSKIKYLTMLLFMGMVLFFIPNISNAAASATRNIYSNNGSMKFNFVGLELDTKKEYEFALTKTAVAQPEKWYLITEYTASTATVDIVMTNAELREVFNAADTGYITIRNKATSTIAVDHYAVDLKIPYLQVASPIVIDNGKEFRSDQSESINVSLRNKSVSTAYYQYEKITDQSIINKYKEIKAKSGDYLELQNLLKTTTPTSNWTAWSYWNGYDSSTGMDGYGYTQATIQAPDTGLYYMWLYFSGKDIKNMYGYILVDNLEPDIALQSISLPSTKTVELGKTITLTPTFNPSTATNKIVTWKSSDETVATVDIAGKVTPKKVGSTVITVTSQDGNKKATCTVTVTNQTNNSTSTQTKEDNSTKETKTTNTPKTDTKTIKSEETDNTTAVGKLPYTGAGIGLAVFIIIMSTASIFASYKYNRLKGI